MTSSNCFNVQQYKLVLIPSVRCKNGFVFSVLTEAKENWYPTAGRSTRMDIRTYWYEQEFFDLTENL